MPIDLARIIRNVVLAMASGDRISIATTLPEELTTTVAASQLGVSRPTLMKMIGNGEIASHKVGSHHRLLAAVEEYKRRRLQRQREAFDKLRGLDELLEKGVATVWRRSGKRQWSSSS